MSRAEDDPSATPLPRTLGYARVSTDSQALAPQVESLKAAGASQVFRETASGAKRDRAQLARLLKEVRSGDVVLVTRLDRARALHTRPPQRSGRSGGQGCRLPLPG